jgi:uncharacterized protein YjbJ (UPF0337 family)
MVGRLKQKFGGLTYGYKRASAGRREMLQGKTRENRGRIREKLAKAKIRIIR